jgi:ACS family hexuronate transporter-like MFS transporter
VTWRPGWLTLLTYRQTWAVVVGRFITDPIWWLYIFWLPSYFQEARGFSLQQIGASAWLPFLCAGIGALSGGWASGFLIQRGWSVDRARKAVMAVGALLTAAGILAVRVENPYTALLLMGVVLFGFQIWINNLQTLPSDVFPRSAVASVFGLGGTSAAIASVLYNWGTGRVVDAVGYTPVFVIAGVLGPLGLIATLLLAGRIAPLSEAELR